MYNVIDFCFVPHVLDKHTHHLGLENFISLWSTQNISKSTHINRINVPIKFYSHQLNTDLVRMILNVMISDLSGEERLIHLNVFSCRFPSSMMPYFSILGSLYTLEAWWSIDALDQKVYNTWIIETDECEKDVWALLNDEISSIALLFFGRK